MVSAMDNEYVESFLASLVDMDEAVRVLRGADWAFVVYRSGDSHGSYGVGIMTGEDVVFSNVALRELEDYYVDERWGEEDGDGSEDADA